MPRLGSNTYKDRQESKGFTLFELLLVIVILGFSTALVFPTFASGLTSIKIKTTSRRVATAFNYARDLAISEGNTYTVYLSKEKIIISTASESYKEIRIPEEIKINTEHDTVKFFPRGSSSGGAFEVLDKNGRPAYLIKIEPATGRVKVKTL